MATLLELKNISKEFPGVKALENINLKIEENTIHAICGENGAGKSTLISILGGIYPVGTYEGEIYLHGEKMKFRNPKEAEEAGIAVVHQELSLFDELNIVENIFMGKAIVKGVSIDWNAMIKEAKEWLKKLKMENENVLTKVKYLGSAKQQLIEIAKALVKNCNILILDEPTSSLTENETKILFDILKELKSEGVTSIYISHKLDEIFELADAVSILRDGKLIDTRPISEVKESDLIKMMVGREINQMFPKRRYIPNEIIFEVSNYTLFEEYDPQRKVVEDVSFNLRKGEILGLFGLVGAGRTELMTSIIGFNLSNKSGRIFLNSKELEISSPRQALELGIAYLSENRKRLGIFPNLSVRQNLSITFIKEFGSYFKISEEEEIVEALRMIKQLNIKTSTPEANITTLSGGNQQKVLLGRNLIRTPKILIMDEPTKGIDVGAKQEIYSLMNDLTSQGISIIMISSELPEIIGMSDRVIVMHEGKFMGALENINHDLTQEEVMYLATATKGGGVF
ncbi:D-ribose transporter ATP-binding protein [Petrotoga sp. HKA.pet.4.5]|jgi:D-xylose transport system ATP-binding protein|uniref:sugar ABC transporter ATP-binding protein n=1 Tax=unclassified Petrotoga TaxID=2620614 RepID=UPI000E857665|nr:MULTISPECIES: ATP-binding cassette domain-containing protein [unclassified Petrotoga]RLL84019.1 D-ribose transporter ATP-binding protein [Petrotoga sp. Shatin.DS.tank11.9.2.9.3]RLL90357.1 D-ribose transporter ATP-binding protein [Petrotoga sp. HKA.pet.4.5]HBT51492.1 D-xylose ABC transporter ATP-binding protein [Petrotoga sp.]